MDVESPTITLQRSSKRIKKIKNELHLTLTKRKAKEIQLKPENYQRIQRFRDNSSLFSQRTRCDKLTKNLSQFSNIVYFPSELRRFFKEKQKLQREDIEKLILPSFTEKPLAKEIQDMRTLIRNQEEKLQDLCKDALSEVDHGHLSKYLSMFSLKNTEVFNGKNNNEEIKRNQNTEFSLKNNEFSLKNNGLFNEEIKRNDTLKFSMKNTGFFNKEITRISPLKYDVFPEEYHEESGNFFSKFKRNESSNFNLIYEEESCEKACNFFRKFSLQRSVNSLNETGEGGSKEDSFDNSSFNYKENNKESSKEFYNELFNKELFNRDFFNKYDTHSTTPNTSKKSSPLYNEKKNLLLSSKIEDILNDGFDEIFCQKFEEESLSIENCIEEKQMNFEFFLKNQENEKEEKEEKGDDEYNKINESLLMIENDNNLLFF